MIRVLLLLFLTLLAGSAGALEIKNGSTYYTRVNLWYENPENIPSTNYHRGEMLPVNTKVKLVRIKNALISFEDEDGQRFTIMHNPSYVHIHARELFARLFSDTDVMLGNEAYEKFTDLEKENIQKGTLSVGMGKDAAIMAYGYPPTHKTPSLDRPVWRYWDNRVEQVLVYFKGGKISKVEGIMPGGFVVK